MEVHNILGKGHSEVVYKDALEYELKINSIPINTYKILRRVKTIAEPMLNNKMETMI